jgi:hypothetical protein
MAKKEKRDRGWKADEKRKKLKNLSNVVTTAPGPPPAVTGITTGPDTGLLFDWLYQWARDMHSWGQDVRDDIIRLEGHAGFATGDPGDPPDGPPEP